MRKVLKAFRSYLEDQSGQSSIEYIMLLAIVATIIIKFKGQLDEKIGGVMDTAFSKINDALSK